MSETNEELRDGEASAAPSCSALASALALVDFGPCKTAARPQDWMNVAAPMCEHCEGLEDVNLAAARIITAEYRKALAALKAIEEIYSYGRDIEDDFTAMGNLARNYVCPPNAIAEP